MPKQTTFKTWDQYTQEAALDAFRLPVSDEETLTIEAPTGVALMRIAQGLRDGDLELILRSIAGDHWERITELLAGASHKALPMLTEDLMDYFELYDDVVLIGPGGGRVVKRRPREIRAMLNQGYRVLGEDRAS